jgi:hypothetical protein
VTLTSADNRAGQRVNVTFSEQAYATLVALAQAEGKTLSETLRDALALKKWMADAQRAGAHVLIERNGRLQEVVTL